MSLRLNSPATRTRLIPWAIFFLALLVRLWKLTDHSLWFDEAMSLHWAQQSLADIWRVGFDARLDPHPPLYYLLMAAVVRLFGAGEVAARLPSVLIGAALVFPIIGLGRRLHSNAAGLIAALLIALSPFMVWYSQEARMYAQATTLGVAALYLLMRALEEEETRLWWIGFILASLAALYTYLLTAVLLPVAACWLLLACRHASSRRQAFIGFLALGLVSLGFLPLAFDAWQSRATLSVLPSGPPPATLAVLRNWLGVWAWHKAGWDASLGWIVAAIALAGAAIAPPRGRLHLLTFLFLPLALAFLLAQRDPLVLAETRYFIVAVPPILLGVASLLAWLLMRWRLLGILVVIVILGASYTDLRANWDPIHRREDWRAAANYVTTHSVSGDTILVHVDYMNVAFQQYYRGALPVYFPFHDQLTDLAQVTSPLEGMSDFDTIWLVQSHTGTFDPNHLVERWLSERYPLVTEQYPAGVLVKGYAVRTLYDALPDTAHPLDATFGPYLRLAGCRIDDTRLQSHDDRLHPPSGWVHARLYWQTQMGWEGDFTPIVRLVDGVGQVWGELLDRQANVFHRLPPSQWPSGIFVRDDEDINVNPIAPPGRYRILVGVRDQSGEQITAEGENSVAGMALCGDVEIVP